MSLVKTKIIEDTKMYSYYDLKQKCKNIYCLDIFNFFFLIQPIIRIIICYSSIYNNSVDTQYILINTIC